MENKITEKVQNDLEKVLLKCEIEKYPNIVKFMKYKVGKDIVINMVYNRLINFPNYTLANCITDVELFLNEQGNE